MAVKHNGMAIIYLSEKLKADEEVGIAIVKQSQRVFVRPPAELKANWEVGLTAFAINGCEAEGRQRCCAWCTDRTCIPDTECF